MVSVHGDEEARIYLLMYPERFVSVGVAGGVNVHGVAMDYLGTLPREVVLELLHGTLVARHYG